MKPNFAGVVLSGIVAAILASGWAVGAAREKNTDTVSTKSKTPVVIKQVTRYSTKELHHFPETEPPKAPPSPADTGSAELENAISEEYRIQPGDVLEFQSFDDPSLSREILVRYDGCISLPLIPDLKITDSTREEAIAAVQKAYAGVFKEPQLTLTIRDAASKVYYVMGDVARPNEYPYKRRLSVFDAINLAGGQRINMRGGDAFVGAQGQLTKAFVIRHAAGNRNVIELDLRGLSTAGAHASDTPIYPGDIVYVPEGVNLVYLIGEVRRSDVFQLREGMTLLQLLAQAGGYVPQSAKLRHVVLMREVDPQSTDVMLIDVKAILKTGQDVPLRPGDVIYIPRKDLVRLQEFVQRFTGSISPVLNLYTQAWDAYYTKDRFEAIFNDANGTNNVLGVLQGLRTFGNFLQSIPTP